MNDSDIQPIVIVGGGTAGWMAAIALAKFISSRQRPIILVESEAIGTVGVGEATMPSIVAFNRAVGIDEAEFLRETQATYKLGIEFEGWGSEDSRYIHPFGDFGFPIDHVDFHQFWLKCWLQGHSDPIGDYCAPIHMCRENKFERPHDLRGEASSAFSYAYHFDAGLYARYLRKKSEALGVTRIEGKILEVGLRANGDVEKLFLDNGTEIQGSFFLDCTGFRALLIEQTLGAGFESWRDLLKCDSAVAAASEALSPVPPYTRCRTHKAGWSWKIPLQHRSGNGVVYASEYMDESEALALLEQRAPGALLNEPKRIRFEAGKRNKTWLKNCVAIGLSGGFLEPLESTSIYLIQVAIMHLIDLFPGDGDAHYRRREFNRLMDKKYYAVRDVLVLHYFANQREDSKFWVDCKNLDIPGSLKERMDLFVSTGKIVERRWEPFLKNSWLSIYLGQNVIPRAYDMRVDKYEFGELQKKMLKLSREIASSVDHIRDHDSALTRNSQGHGR